MSCRRNGYAHGIHVNCRRHYTAYIMPYRLNTHTLIAMLCHTSIFRFPYRFFVRLFLGCYSIHVVCVLRYFILMFHWIIFLRQNDLKKNRITTAVKCIELSWMVLSERIWTTLFFVLNLLFIDELAYFSFNSSTKPIYIIKYTNCVWNFRN